MMSSHVDLRSNYPNVATLMGGYLHQDFDRENGSADGAVRAFIDVSTRSECVAFARESSILLASYDDSSLEAALDRMGNAFDYLSIGLTARTWLERLATQISDASENRS